MPVMLRSFSLRCWASDRGGYLEGSPAAGTEESQLQQEQETVNQHGWPVRRCRRTAGAHPGRNGPVAVSGAQPAPSPLYSLQVPYANSCSRW